MDPRTDQGRTGPTMFDVAVPGVPGSPGEPLTVAAPAGFDWAMTGLGAALVVGAVIDGWAHNHDPGLETFFTPWHALLYSALLVNGVVLGLRWLAGLRRGLRCAGRCRAGTGCHSWVPCSSVSAAIPRICAPA